MTKTEIVSAITPILKEKGFKKVKNFWYKMIPNILHYIHIQGSQYDKNDYYCNICIAIEGYNNLEFPKEYDSQVFHRVGVRDDLKNDRNPPLDYIMKFADDYFTCYDTKDKIRQAYKNKVGSIPYDVKYGEFRKFCEN